MKKQKQKTKKIIVKRFKITKKGKVLRRRSFTGHLNAKKTSRRKRSLSGYVETDKVHSKKIKKIMGVK